MARTKKTETAPEATENTQATPEKKHRYFASMVGMSGDNPYAFHLEGALTRKPNMLPAQEDKASMAIVSMGITMDRNALLAKAKHEDAPEVAEDQKVPFVTLAFYGKLADKICSEEMKDKGQLICVSGRLTTFKQKDGTDGVEVVVDNYMLMGNDCHRTKRISVAPDTFTNKDGVLQTNQMVSLLTGNVINSPELKTSQKGNPYLRVALGMAVPAKKVYDLATTGKVGEYEEDADNVLILFFFGKDAEVKSRLIHKGAILAVTGQIQENPYNGQVSYKMMPWQTSIVKFGEQPDNTPAAPADASTFTASADDDGFAGLSDEDDDELPF